MTQEVWILIQIDWNHWVFRPLQLTVLKATHTITGLYVKSWLAVFVLGPVVVQSRASTQSGDARKRSREKSGSRSGHI